MQYKKTDELIYLKKKKDSLFNNSKVAFVNVLRFTYSLSKEFISI